MRAAVARLPLQYFAKSSEFANYPYLSRRPKHPFTAVV